MGDPGSGLYMGWREVYVSGCDIDLFYREGALVFSGRPELYPNEFAILRAFDDPNASALARRSPRRSDLLVPLVHSDERPWDVTPLNAPQRMLMELLLDPQVSLVASPSKAGTGKNVLAMAAGLAQVEQGIYDRVVVYKPLVPLGRDVGFLPGELDEKLAPHHASTLDTLAFLVGRGSHKSVASRVDAIIDSGMVELSTFTFIRGTNLPRQFIIIDEAQNIDIATLKAALTRAAEGTKVVVLGHPGQIDAHGITEETCGITQLVRKFMGQAIFGSVTLTTCVRSELARLADELL